MESVREYTHIGTAWKKLILYPPVRNSNPPNPSIQIEFFN